VVQLVDARELFTKMRKSLGNKRNEIGPEQISEITRLYGSFEENERVKIIPNPSFGFHRITVERPLRLRYEVTDATLPTVKTSSGWAKMTEPERLSFVGRLQALNGLVSTDKAEIARLLVPLPKAIEKAVWDALAVRDPNAPVITDREGHPVPDPDLRDNENVPLPGPVHRYEEDPTERLASPSYHAAVDAYMSAEVLPFVPDAWVDRDKTKIGYEIPLTRQFYRYIPPRPLVEIDAEIRAVEEEIQRLLREVTA
jgi:type I restriction enzyme M protein